MSNAVKFTPEKGKITLKVTELPDDYLIQVIDNGLGIAEEQHELIFEKFRQVDSSQTRKYEGSGLGLAIAKHFVQLHKGKIWVQSKPAEGSCFSFTLHKKL